MTLLVGVHHY